MEVSGRKTEHDDHNKGILCDPCLGVDEEEKALFYCTVCNEFLCDADARAHRKAAMSKSHRLLDRNCMPRQKLRSYEDTICQIHRKILGYFCNPHNKSCCSVCATKEHKQCEIEYIDDIAKEYEKSSEYKSLIEDMTDLTQRLQSAKQNSVDNKCDAQRLHSDVISEIRTFRVEINNVLDFLENALLTESNGVLLVDSNAAKSTVTSCDTLMAKLQEMTSSIENLRKYKQERQLVMHSRNAQAQVKDIEDEVSKLSNRNKRKHYKFIPDKAIPQLLQSLKSLGRLEITEERTKTKENVQNARKDHVAELLVPVVNQPVKASHVCDINIQHSTDNSTLYWIIGGVMIDQNTLALVDRKNGSVKLVDVISDNVTSCIKLPSGPWDITRVEQDLVVVSCDWGKLVFLNVDKALSIVKQLDVGGWVRGIAYTNNSLLVGFGYPDPCVKVMDLRGKTLNTFKTDAAGKDIFNDPESIALSEDQKTILVSDPSNRRVTCLRMDGTVQGVFTDGNLRGPHGLAVDRDDNVYVAGTNSHNIYQLSTECKPIRVLLDTTHGIERPLMVTYCKTEHKLYVGFASWSGKRHISVFQLL